VFRRRHIRPARFLALATAAMFGLILVPAVSGHAAPAPGTPPPPSAAEARRMHAALAAKMTKTTEEYNTAVVLASRGRVQEAAMRRQAVAQQAKVKDYEIEVAEFAASAYRGGRIDVVTSLLESGSPQVFLDQMATLDNLSRTQRAQLNELVGARRALEQQQQKIAAVVAGRSSISRPSRPAEPPSRRTWRRGRRWTPGST